MSGRSDRGKVERFLKPLGSLYPMNKELKKALDSYFVDGAQLTRWCDASENIREDWRLEKALGYLVGEKFYEMIHSFRWIKKHTTELGKRKLEPDYDPIVREGKYVTNLDERYKEGQTTITRLDLIIPEFARLIRESYDTSEILTYFSENPRMGALGHVLKEEDHEFFTESGAVEHSLETEVEDTLIIGEMKKLLIDSSVYE